MRDLNKEYQYRKFPMTWILPDEQLVNEMFDIHVVIRGCVVGIFKRKSLSDPIPKLEADEFLELGKYLADVMNVEEEYPHDLFLLELRTERMLNGLVS